MVIVKLSGGLGNQMDQYAIGRLLALKLNTKLKLIVVRAYVPKDVNVHIKYVLDAFNIVEDFATPEELRHVQDTGTIIKSIEDFKAVVASRETFQGDVIIEGHWMHSPHYYQEIAGILKKEFTLKKPLSLISETWRQKILSAECSVSMHFRHGDYVYNKSMISWISILPLDYYYTCVNILKQRYDNLTVFVFSNNLPWVKENLHLDVPTEFVEGCETDVEEFVVMSLCKHNIIANSTFSGRAAWLNQNPDKKMFLPAKSTLEGVQKFLATLTPAKKDALLNTNGYIWVPYDNENQPEVTQCFFSLLLVVNNDAPTIAATLDNLLGQDYKYYEVIIVDNASTDGSDKICQDAIKDKANVTYKRLDSKVSNATAWNTALDLAQGKYVSFLKSGDCFLPDSLTKLYIVNHLYFVDLIHMFTWQEKGSTQCDIRFKNEKRNSFLDTDGQAAAKFLRDKQINSFLGTKFYNRDFLSEHELKFDENLPDVAAELSFQAEAFTKSKYFLHVKNTFYIAPKV